MAHIPVALRWDDINLQQASCMRAASKAVDKRTSPRGAEATCPASPTA